MYLSYGTLLLSVNNFIKVPIPQSPQLWKWVNGATVWWKGKKKTYPVVTCRLTCRCRPASWIHPGDGIQKNTGQTRDTKNHELCESLTGLWVRLRNETHLHAHLNSFGYKKMLICRHRDFTAIQNHAHDFTQSDQLQKRYERFFGESWIGHIKGLGQNYSKSFFI